MENGLEVLVSCFDRSMTNSDEARLPGLSSTDTRWLVGEAQRVLTDLGHESSLVDGVALGLPGGRTMGLDNLARTLSLMPRKRWSRAVRDQLSTLLSMDPTQPVVTSDLRAKLMPREEANALLEYEAIEPLPGVVALLAAQGDRASNVFWRLDMVGDRDAAYDAALTNLASLRLPRHTRRRVDPRVPGSWVEFLDSSDAYGAARVLVLPDLLRRVLGTDFPRTGVLVAVPTKHELWVHIPVDESVADTAVAMSWLSFRTWAEEPYPVSPDVFLVSPDMQATRLVTPDNQGCYVSEQAMRELLRAVEGPEHGLEAS